MSTPLYMVCESFFALGAKVSWHLVVLPLVTLEKPLVWCFIETLSTTPCYTFVYLHMFCEFVGAVVAMITSWMYTYVILYPLVGNFVDCQVRFKVKSFTTPVYCDRLTLLHIPAPALNTC